MFKQKIAKIILLILVVVPIHFLASYKQQIARTIRKFDPCNDYPLVKKIFDEQAPFYRTGLHSDYFINGLAYKSKLLHGLTSDFVERHYELELLKEFEKKAHKKVCIDDKKIRGFVAYSLRNPEFLKEKQLNSDFMYIDGIVGFGCGKMMLNYVEEQAAMQDKDKVIARVLKSNQQGISALKKNGYSPLQETDCIVLMIKEL